MRVIQLTRGQVAIVDGEDFEKLAQYRWYARDAGNTNYAERRAYVLGSGAKNRKESTMIMHRIIMNAQPGQIVDHRNGNGLDNRKENLRFATKSQNSTNAGRRITNKSGFKGVWEDKKRNAFQASITLNGKRQSLGRFKTKEEAHRAYCEAALQKHGEFARFN